MHCSMTKITRNNSVWPEPCTCVCISNQNKKYESVLFVWARLIYDVACMGICAKRLQI